MDIRIDKFDFDILRIIDETGQYVEINLIEELAVNENNLLQEMLQQPSKYIYWSSILEKLKMFQENRELEAEKTWAKLDTKAREYCKARDIKPTKDVVEAFIKQQPEYESAQHELHYYNFIVGRVGRIVKAFEQRKDMLQSYGKQIADMKGYGAGAGTHIERS